METEIHSHLGDFAGLTSERIRSLSLILREVRGSGEVSPERLARGNSRVSESSVRDAAASLAEVGVLQVNKANPSKYVLSGDDTASRDFLILKMAKGVKVSSEGNRGVKVRAQLMTLRDKVAMRQCGSMIWSNKVKAPKYRLDLAHRSNPLTLDKPMRQDFEVLKGEKNDMVFRLNFQPPLSTGEVVDYSFNIWTPNYYALTKKEAVERYRDEWTREGLSVIDPTLLTEIKVILPDTFNYRDARVEKNPVLTPDGPNVPGRIVSTFEKGQRILTFSKENPATGNYFVSWKPPES